MAEQVARPTTRLTYHIFQQLFQSGFTLSKLKDTVGQGQLLHSSDGAIGIPGRSLAWKARHRYRCIPFLAFAYLFLLKDEPLEPSPDEVPSIPIKLLRSSRQQFSEVLLEKMKAPDGSYDESFVVPGLTIPRQKTQLAVDLEMNNPLSLHDEARGTFNPWRAWFAAVDLRKTIQQDVERTFPDMGYFRNQDVQHQLTNVLFLYCQMHPDIGYRQGMHELLAPLYYAIDFDSVAESESPGPDPLFSELCSRSWVAADSWALFSSLMDHISHWYEWREPTSPPSVSRGPINLKPYVSPIIQTCNNIQGTLLKSVDPVLHDAMQSAGVEPQLYGLRWLRLLFTREFPMDEAMMLWDGLFASSSPLPDIVQWTCVAMLIRIRTKLISSDYNTQLMHVLRYPPCPVHAEAASHHILLLIRQATALEMLHTPSAGAFLAIENRNFLNIPIEVPEPPPVIRRKARPTERTHQTSSSDNMSGSPPTEILRQQPASQLGFPELIARGLLDRGESLGINRTVMHAVSELKRNLPDLSSTLGRPPSFGSSSMSSYPLLDERTPTAEKYTWDHRSGFESAREGTSSTTE
ncbi:rab-GTPase-TBC domain-containing protein [Boletus edulis BED1]|uniref:Rab-GTPase-TBC domain-containing protein n=1 Tax=Boletus edulis BED1 TaxID=1328754 RepID=A0AAD4C3N9_BOLED|nr:rab-GTPase-TBC domain-containing protein [Boletus edulis BED1]